MRQSSPARLAQLDRVPPAVEVHRDIPPPDRNGRARASPQTSRADRDRNDAGGLATQVLDDPVVGKDLHLIVRKRHREKCVPLARSLVRAAAADAHARRSRHDDDRRRCTAPARRQTRSEAPCLIGRPEPSRRRAAHRRPRRNQTAASLPMVRWTTSDDRGGRAIGQEHRPGLGADRQHVARAVVLFVAAGPLVLLDDVPRRTHRARSSRPRRSARAAPSAAGRRRDSGALLEHSGAAALKRAEVSRGLVVHHVGVRISSRRQIDLRRATRGES